MTWSPECSRFRAAHRAERRRPRVRDPASARVRRRTDGRSAPGPDAESPARPTAAGAHAWAAGRHRARRAAIPAGWMDYHLLRPAYAAPIPWRPQRRLARQDSRLFADHSQPVTPPAAAELYASGRNPGFHAAG